MTLKLGVIGTGAIGKDHIRRCTKVLQGAEVVAVSDINLESAKQIVNDLDLNARIYEHSKEVIEDPTVEALIITSWDPTHEEFVLASIKAGKPVFCEKPLAITAAGCKRIVDAEMAYGKRLVQVGFMRRYDPGYVLLKNTLDQNEIGPVLMLHCAHRNPTVPEHYSTDMAITNTLIHELDILRWLLKDEYRSVQVVFPRKTSHATEALRDPQVVLIETHKGVRIDVEIFVNCQYGYDIQCEIVGEIGIAKLPEPSAIVMRKDAKFSTAILTDWKDRFITAYDIELQSFIHGATNRCLTGPSSWDGYAAAVAADACIKAQLSGEVEPVNLSNLPDFYGNLTEVKRLIPA